MNSANSAQETEEGESDEEEEEEEDGRGEERRGEDSAEVNHKTTHRGSGKTKGNEQSANNADLLECLTIENYKFWKKMRNPKMPFGVFGALCVIYIDVYNVSMRSSLRFCICEHVQNYVFAA